MQLPEGKRALEGGERAPGQDERGPEGCKPVPEGGERVLFAVEPTSSSTSASTASGADC